VIVLDASVVLGWFITGETRDMEALRHVEERGGITPGNFQSEVAHGLLRAERQGRIDTASASQALQEVLALSLDVILPELQNVMATAREYRLTGYGASYLALARQSALPLATADAALGRAADALNLLWRPAS
jgi:predicted nucleic acid-binding protein